MRNLWMLPVGLTLAVVAAAGCSSGGATGTPTATPTGTNTGTPTPTPSGTPIVIPVTATEEGVSSTPASGVAVSVFINGNATAIGTGTTASTGSASISAFGGGTSFSGYVTGALSGNLTNYFYPAVPFTLGGDNSVTLEMLTPSIFGTLSSLAGVTQTSTLGVIGVLVQDSSGNAITGATVTSTPAGTYKYNSGGIPSGSATSTGSDGVAYILNVAVGTVTINAAATGKTFVSHPVTTFANGGTPGTITTSIIQN
jgi:hypothetical protein